MATETFGGPPPIAYLQQIGPEPFMLPSGTLLFRIHNMGGAHWTHWNAFRGYGPTANRFDHHDPPPHEQERQISYVATDGATCFAECFQRFRTIDRARNDPWLVAFRTTGPLTLLDLTGSWPTRAGGSQEINTGDHPTCRAWSRAVYAAYPDIAGLYYRAKMLGGRFSIALYERAIPALPVAPLLHYPLTYRNDEFQQMVIAVADDIGYNIT